MCTVAMNIVPLHTYSSQTFIVHRIMSTKGVFNIIIVLMSVFATGVQKCPCCGQSKAEGGWAFHSGLHGTPQLIPLLTADLKCARNAVHCPHSTPIPGNGTWTTYSGSHKYGRMFQVPCNYGPGLALRVIYASARHIVQMHNSRVWTWACTPSHICFKKPSTLYRCRPPAS
jgi:hypothetical protein